MLETVDDLDYIGILWKKIGSIPAMFFNVFQLDGIPRNSKEFPLVGKHWIS